MGCKAGWMLGGLLGMGLVAGCGDDGGGVVTNTTWQLSSSSGTSFDLHDVMGANGELGNTVQCSFDGVYLNFGIIDEAMEGGYGTGTRSVIEVQAKADGSVCNVKVKEQYQGDLGALVPEYKDACGSNGGCTVSFTVDGGNVDGTLRCTEMKDNQASNPLLLSGPADTTTNSRGPMTFSFEKCN